MSTLLHAFQVFFEYLTSIGWDALAIAVLCHLAKVACRTRAWRNILGAAYPTASVPWRRVAGAYVAGVGVNAVVPARGGDVLKLYLAKRAIPGSSYPTLLSTLVVETLFDLAVASALFVWAVQLGVLPGLNVLPDLTALDWAWILRHPWPSAAIGGALVGLAALAALRGARHVVAFKRRVAQGFTVLGDRRLYVRRVAAWQALDWLLRLAAIYWFLRAFGIGATAHNTLLVQVTNSLSTVVPITPGGIGTEQALLVYVFAGQVSTAALLGFSVGMKAVLVAVNALLGFGAIALALRTLRWRQVVVRERRQIALESELAGAAPAPSGADPTSP